MRVGPMLRQLSRLEPQVCSTSRGLHSWESSNVSSLVGIRGVLRLAGEPLVHFLQGLVTNDVSGMDAGGAGLLYACLLNAQGRLLHDMFIHPIPGAPEPAVYLDVDAEGLPDLARLLKRYRLRQKLDIADVSGEAAVFVRGPGDGADDGWFPDPRLPELGQRMVGPWSAGDAEAAAAFKALRYGLGVPEGDVEMPSGQAMPLEYNLDALHGVAYDKGCYIGQELVARTHYKGVIRKRVMPVRLEGAAGSPATPGAELASVATEPGASAPAGRAKGTLRAVQGTLGLAMVRQDAGLPAAAGTGPALCLRDDQGVRVVPGIPAWWPREWWDER